MAQEGEETVRRAYRVREVAQMTGLSTAKIRALVALNRIRAVKLGPRSTVIPATEVDRLLGSAR